MVKATGVHKIHSSFSVSGGVLSFTRDNASTQLAFGEDGTGLDFKLYGDTASAWVLWDESADSLIFASSAKLDITSASVHGALILHADSIMTINSASINISDSCDFHFGTGSGSKIATASLQKLGFFGVTPVVQPAKVVSTATASSLAIAILNGLEDLGFFSATA